MKKMNLQNMKDKKIKRIKALMDATKIKDINQRNK